MDVANDTVDASKPPRLQVGNAIRRSDAGTVVTTENENPSNSSREWAPVIGFGTGYQLNPDWQLQLNWRRIVGTEPGVLGKQDLDLLTAGLQFGF